MNLLEHVGRMLSMWPFVPVFAGPTFFVNVGDVGNDC